MIFTYDFCPTHFRMAENDRCGFLSFSWALLILGRSFFPFDCLSHLSPSAQV